MIDIRENAERFAVYRMGIKNFWECTYAEVAEVTGLTIVRVKAICLARGWRFTSVEDEVGSLDSFMSLDGPIFHV